MTEGLDTEPDMTAAELALGVLDGEERAAALRRQLVDPAFAREVEDWRYRLAGLFDDYREAPSPEALAGRLAAPAESSRTRNVWTIAAIATALAAAGVLFLAYRPGPSPVPLPVPVAQPHQIIVASLMTSDKSASVPVVIDQTTGELSIPHADIAPAGKSAQLWVIGGDGVPQSLGLLAKQGTSRLTVPEGQRRQLSAGMKIAVSVEPEGGSRTGKPTGPVVATGKLSLA